MGLIDDYLTHTITITPKGTLGGDGKYDYDGTVVTTKARPLDKKKLLRTVNNTEIVADREFWLAAGETIAIGDRITWGSDTHEVIDIYKPRTVTGVMDHIKVWVKTH
jgi:hypothetical protein